MRIRRYLCICLAILMILLCSCESKTAKTKDEILEEAESFLAETKSAEEIYKIHFGYQEGMGSWLEAETEYLYDENGDNSYGIISPKENKLSEDRLYFQLTKQTELSTGSRAWAYVNVKTGEKHYICPDPFCEQNKDSGCPYLNLFQITFNPDSNKCAYAVKDNNIYDYNMSRYVIYEINFEQNTLREIYNASTLNSDAKSKYDFIDLYFIRDNILYFKDRFVEKEVVNDEQIVKETSYLVGLNLETKEIDVLVENFDTIHEFYILGDHIYFHDMNNKRFYCTDMNLENEKELITYEEGYGLYSMYYDSNTEELYVLISNLAIHRADLSVKNPETIKCTLYCIDNNLNLTELPMPSSQLLDFQLTNEYIYYTAYYPIDYMTPPYTRHAIDTAGNKIYRVKRSDTTTPELVFDGHGELFFQGYFVTGDYIYMTHYGLVIRAEGQVFRYMGSDFRVNIKKNTLKWMNLD